LARSCDLRHKPAPLATAYSRWSLIEISADAQQNDA
jgi:hypothetical protein